MNMIKEYIIKISFLSKNDFFKVKKLLTSNGIAPQYLRHIESKGVPLSSIKKTKPFSPSTLRDKILSFLRIRNKGQSRARVLMSANVNKKELEQIKLVIKKNSYFNFRILKV